MQYQKTVEIPFSHLLKHTENESLLPPFTTEHHNDYFHPKLCTFQLLLEQQQRVVAQAPFSFFLVKAPFVLSEMGFNGYIPCIVKKMDLAEQRTYIENNALARRNLSKEDKIKIAQRQVARGISQATVSKTLGMSQAWVSEQTSSVKDVHKESEKQAIETLRNAGVTQKETANIVGVSKNTVINVEKETSTKIINSGNFGTSPDAPKPSPETDKNQAIIRAKEILLEERILEAAREIRQERSKNKIAERKALIEEQNQMIASGGLPEINGMFDIVVIDTPWPYGREYNPETSRIANPYPEMSIEEIKKIKIPLKENGMTFLWTTHQFLPHAFDLAQYWETSYKATPVWDKQKMGMGNWFRMQCEFCLVLTKGNIYTCHLVRIY